MSKETTGTGDTKVVRVTYTHEVREDRVREYVLANALPGDNIVIEDPETGESETFAEYRAESDD